MNRREVSDFLRKIKCYFQNFSVNDFVLEEWGNVLKNYDSEDVYKSYYKYLNSDSKNELPKIHVLVQNLKTKEEKNKNIKYIVLCPLCKTKISLSNLDKHYERCSSVDFICRMSKKYYNRVLNRNDLLQLNENEFMLRYMKFCKNLLNDCQDDKDLSVISAIVNPKENIDIVTKMKI